MTKEEIFNLLITSVDKFNAWREANPDHPVDLERADLTRRNIDMAKLHRANLRGACLDHTSMVCVQLAHADLSGASLDHTILDHSQLSCANLGEVRASFASFRGVLLDGASVYKARFHHSHFPAVAFSDILHLATADFYDSEITKKAQDVLVAAIRERWRDAD